MLGIILAIRAYLPHPRVLQGHQRLRPDFRRADPGPAGRSASLSFSPSLRLSLPPPFSLIGRNRQAGKRGRAARPQRSRSESRARVAYRKHCHGFSGPYVDPRGARNRGRGARWGSEAWAEPGSGAAAGQPALAQRCWPSADVPAGQLPAW